MPRQAVIRRDGVEQRIAGYVEKMQNIISMYGAEQRLPYVRTLNTYIFDEKTRYAKVYCNENDSKQGSIFAFIDMTNGDILKPASAKIPAKGARGNVFDDDYGTQYSTVYGPAYAADMKKFKK